MAKRVLLIAIGIGLYQILRAFDVPIRLAYAAVLLPFLLAEAWGLVPGPYDKTMLDVMHESADPESKDSSKHG